MGSEKSILIGFSEVRFDKGECRPALCGPEIRISGKPASDQEAGSAAAQRGLDLHFHRFSLLPPIPEVQLSKLPVFMSIRTTLRHLDDATPLSPSLTCPPSH